MSINYKRPTILNSVDDWVVGSGSQGSYGQNGTVNTRITGTDPFGGTSVLWQGVSPGDSNADGGFEHSGVSIDPTKLYRFSVWAKRTSSTGTFTFYFGTGSNVYLLSLNGDVGAGNNPYWECSAGTTLTQNVWYLFVAHIFPSDFPNNAVGIGHPNTGKWTIAGGRVGGVNQCNIGFQDLKFAPTSSTAIIRSYMYYSNSTTDTMLWYGARIELCDGSEGTIESLLSNELNTKLSSLSITKEGSSFRHQKVVAYGGEVSNVGEWRIHKFTSTSSLIISSYVGSALRVEYLIVGGGGGGGANMGGGGGGGGVLIGFCYLSGTTYTITVGGGGTGAPNGTGGHNSVAGSNGSNSSFNGLTAYGGGFGGFSPNAFCTGFQGNNGGCGGGSTGYNHNAATPGYYGSGTGVSGQGYRGGYQGDAYFSGGGGGAGASGADGNNSAVGGIGKFSGILGRPYYWGGGGGGGGYSIAGGNGGKGGGGGGGVGYGAGNGGTDAINWGVVGTQGSTNSQANVPGGNGGPYSGGGGGGGSHYEYTNHGGNGGGGIVVIRYKYR